MINHLSKVNELLASRSSDRGRTWAGPTSPWWVPYNQHAFNPLQPRGGKRIVAFCTEPRPDLFHPPHDGGIAMRTSDDQGFSWSAPAILQPTNDPGYRGVGHMRGCETDAGTWLIPTYSVRAGKGGWPNREDTQYVLRSEDRGRSWALLPGPRPKGWSVEPYHRMLEGQILNLGKNRAVMYARVPSGYLWELRTFDDGRTWTRPKSTTLVHPDAPPMIFKLADGKTLAALIHNQPVSPHRAEYALADRRELWVCLSDDDGATWSEPRFLLGDAARSLPPYAWNEVSYCDLLADGGELHLFFDHQKRQILYARFSEADLKSLPTRSEIG
jgi:predicted neuraminidase